jgi:uncharacterized protein (AIM24 family)
LPNPEVIALQRGDDVLHGDDMQCVEIELGVCKRLITGESLFITVHANEGRGRKKLAFAAPYTGRIIPFDHRQHGGALVCEKGALLCAAKGSASAERELQPSTHAVGMTRHCSYPG